MEYFIAPKLLKKMDIKGKTSLKKIENQRLKELILQDLAIYEQASISEIWEDVGKEIPLKRIQKLFYAMLEECMLGADGKLKSRKYFITQIL
jgi:ATP-dependent DNA helicase RecG